MLKSSQLESADDNRAQRKGGVVVSDNKFAAEYKRIGAKILYYRRLRGWTQIQLSRESDVSRSRISDIECGKGPYNMESILLIARALDVDYQRLIAKDD